MKNILLTGDSKGLGENIKRKLQGNEFHEVKSWKDTRNLLYSIMTEGII